MKTREWMILPNVCMPYAIDETNAQISVQNNCTPETTVCLLLVESAIGFS